MTKILFKNCLYESVSISKTWYHGTSVDFNEFDINYAHVEDKSIARFGTGFYLTTDLSLAKHYATSRGYIKVVELNSVDKIYNENLKPSLKLAKLAVSKIPNDKVEDILSNWDENPNVAKNKLVSFLMDTENIGEQIQSIWYDCYRYREPEFMNVFSKQLNGIIFNEKGYEVLVAYNKDNLKIVNTIKM